LFSRYHDGKQPRFDAVILRSRCEAMTVLLYFVSIASMFALFASVIVGTFWLLARCLRALLEPSAAPNHRSGVSVDLHPHHLKRAGQ
jgi:hypothetical protein